MPSSNSLVSIIMPCYNSEGFVERSIDSVLKQTYENWELIIIDDCSSDTTASILHKYQKHYSNKIRIVLNKTNIGAAKTRNLGIDKAQGHFIAFIDSDDYWFEKKIATQMQFMESNQSSFSFTGSFVEESGSRKLRNIPRRARRGDILKNNCITTSSVIYNARKAGKAKIPEIHKGQDLAMWLLLMKAFNHADGLDIPLVVYSKRKNSLSANKLSSAKWVWRLYRNVEKMSFTTTLYYFMFYVVNGIRKHFFNVL